MGYYIVGGTPVNVFDHCYFETKTINLGPLTQGIKAKVQLKSSIPIGAKVEISPKGFTLRIKAEIEKIYINQSTPSCVSMLSFIALDWPHD